MMTRRQWVKFWEQYIQELSGPSPCLQFCSLSIQFVALEREKLLGSYESSVIVSCSRWSLLVEKESFLALITHQRERWTTQSSRREWMTSSTSTYSNCLLWDITGLLLMNKNQRFMPPMLATWKRKKKYKGVAGSALHLNTRLVMICLHVRLLIRGLVLQGMSII